jgi:hypothetical protein
MPTRRAAVPPKPRESEVQRAGIALLRGLGCEVHRRNTGAVRANYKGRNRLVRFSEKGASDVWFVMPQLGGRHGEWEAKRPGERPTLDQVLWLRRMNHATGAAFWTDSVEVLETVARHLIRGGRIQYLKTVWRYEGGVHGMGGDYDLV